MNYREIPNDTKESKQLYVDGLERVIQIRQQAAALIRSNYCKDIFTLPDSYREDLRKMLGWPLIDHHAEALPRVRSQKLSDEGGYSIYRMHFEILDGVNMSGVFFKMRGKERKPMVITQHGGLVRREQVPALHNVWIFILKGGRIMPDYKKYIGKTVLVGISVFSHEHELLVQYQYVGEIVAIDKVIASQTDRVTA